MIELKFKLSKIILRLQYAAKGRIERTQKLNKKWNNALVEITNRDKFEINFSNYPSIEDANYHLFKKVFKIISKKISLKIFLIEFYLIINSSILF